VAVLNIGLQTETPNGNPGHWVAVLAFDNQRRASGSSVAVARGALWGTLDQISNLMPRLFLDAAADVCLNYKQ